MRLLYERIENRFSFSLIRIWFLEAGNRIQVMFVAFSAQQKKMELWFACKSLASSLCVEARLLTQIFDTSSQLRLEEFHLLPVDSAMGGTKHCGGLGCEACGVVILFSMIFLASSRCPTSVSVHPRCTAVSYRRSQKFDLQDQALQYLGHAGPYSTIPTGGRCTG